MNKLDLIWICKEMGIKYNKKYNKIQIINQILKPLNNQKYNMNNSEYNFDNFNLSDLDNFDLDNFDFNLSDLDHSDDGYSSSDSLLLLNEDENELPKRKLTNEKEKHYRSSKRRRKNIIRFVYTKSATGDTYNKAPDSPNQLNILSREAEDILSREKVVGISMVIPDGRYSEKSLNKPHEGHTFALSRNDEYLIVYDTHENEYLYGLDFWNNYRKLINYLAEKYNGEFRKIIFFPIVENIWERFKCDSEGSCQAYTRALEEEQMIKKPT